MSTLSTTDPVIKLAWPLVAAITVLALAAVGLYALAPADSKPDLGPLLASAPAALAALGAYWQSRRNAQQVEAHGAVIQKIDEQTNGALDGRIISAVGQAIDQRPGLFTDAAVAQGISSLLAQHLDSVTPAVAAGTPGTVSTVTTIQPAEPASPPSLVALGPVPSPSPSPSLVVPPFQDAP